MNRKQRITVTIGIITFALASLFPPFTGIYLREGDDLTRFIGYHWIFSPLHPGTFVYKLTLEKLTLREVEEGYILIPWEDQTDEFKNNVRKNVTSKLDLKRWAVQSITILVIMGGLVQLQGKQLIGVFTRPLE